MLSFEPVARPVLAADDALDGLAFALPCHRIDPGEVDRVSPTLGDIHVVSNAYADRPSVSIHVYGANIGAVRRHVYDAASGAPREFISGYHNAVMPNLWDCSREAG
jgi:predicted metal-dependent enzyme (double-stranded beta helix superfamily)